MNGKKRIIIADIDMPIVNGNEVAKYVRSTYSNKNTIMVGLTGFMEQANKDYFDLLIPKPFRIKDLLQIIEIA